MLRAFIRFLFFVLPESIFHCLGHIIFDNLEVESIGFDFRERVSKDQQLNKLLSDYLDRCYKIVYDDKMNGKEKKTDK